MQFCAVRAAAAAAAVGVHMRVVCVRAVALRSWLKSCTRVPRGPTPTQRINANGAAMALRWRRTRWDFVSVSRPGTAKTNDQTTSVSQPTRPANKHQFVIYIQYQNVINALLCLVVHKFATNFAQFFVVVCEFLHYVMFACWGRCLVVWSFLLLVLLCRALCCNIANQ